MKITKYDVTTWERIVLKYGYKISIDLTYNSEEVTRKIVDPHKKEFT